MKDFSYLLNRKIEDVDEVKKHLISHHFHKTFFSGEKVLDVEMILDAVSTYFSNNNGYFPLCIMIADRKTDYIYGFILVGNNSILDNQELQSYLSDFDVSFSNLTGLSIIGYGFDERVIDRFWFDEMIRLLWIYLQNQRDDEFYDYIWFDCPLDKIDFYKDKYEMNSLENNPNLLYKFVEM